MVGCNIAMIILNSLIDLRSMFSEGLRLHFYLFHSSIASFTSIWIINFQFKKTRNTKYKQDIHLEDGGSNNMHESFDRP